MPRHLFNGDNANGSHLLVTTTYAIILFEEISKYASSKLVAGMMYHTEPKLCHTADIFLAYLNLFNGIYGVR